MSPALFFPQLKVLADLWIWTCAFLLFQDSSLFYATDIFTKTFQFIFARIRGLSAAVRYGSWQMVE